MINFLKRCTEKIFPSVQNVCEGIGAQVYFPSLGCCNHFLMEDDHSEEASAGTTGSNEFIV